MKPLTHLFGRFVGERNSEDPARFNVVFEHEISHSSGQHARFAAPSAGENKDRTEMMLNRLELRRVEILQVRRSSV